MASLVMTSLQWRSRGWGTAGTRGSRGVRGRVIGRAEGEEQARSLCLNPRYNGKDVELLGRGGNAETFKAYDSETNQEVAIKRMTLRSMTSWKQLELFEREAETLKALANPNIPSYLDYFEEDSEDGTDKRFYIVQELAPGTDLQKMVRAGKRFTDAELTHILSSLLDTIAYLASMRPGVVHRDIKPSNIVVEDPENVCGSRIVLVDFGGVQAAAVDGDEMRMNTMTIVGTLDFMAPEQYRGRTSQLSDVYSAAATLLYLATRKMPHQFPEVRMRIDLDGVEMDGRLKSVLRGMLEPAVEDRLDARRALAVLRGTTGAMSAAGGSRWADRSGPQSETHRSLRDIDSSSWDQSDGSELITSMPIKKPVGSRVTVSEGDDSLVVTIPPAKFDGAAVSIGGFALVWNSFVALWTFTALASGGIIFSLFSLPFWIAGYTMAKMALARQFVSEEFYVDAVSWRLSKRLAVFNAKDGSRDFDGGSAKQQVGFIADLSPAKVTVRGYVNDIPQTDIAIKHGVEEIVFGEGLDEVEQAYIVGKINEWLANQMARPV